MISRLQLCYSHAWKVKGTPDIRFVPGLNVLVGPNGSGKSTILRALHTCSDCRIENHAETATQYFNAELMNPHREDQPPGNIRNMILKTRGGFSSHGEILKTAMFSLSLYPGETFLVDEPESGQDLAGVQRIRQGFEELCESGVQVVVATHHPLLMQDVNLIELQSGYAERVRQSLCRGICHA
jgi:Fe-S cluster assembly ATPase SufC